MNAANSHGTAEPTAVAGTRPVILLRYRPGITGQTARVVHLVPLLAGGQTGAVSALCGVLLHPEEVELLSPGHGMPCSPCALTHTAVRPLPPHDDAPAGASTREEGISAETDPATAGALYRAWGWPVSVRGDQIWLALDRDAVALVIPAPLAIDVAAILSQRRCPPLVLAHPYTPRQRVVLAGEPYPVSLAWPGGVHRVTGTVLLPPTATTRGPVTWVHPPQPNALALCREIDVRAALHTALHTALSDPPRG